MSEDYSKPIEGAPNFTLHEFLFSSDAIRQGIDNAPSAEVVGNLKLLACNIMQPLREKFGPLHVNSGYRCPELNTFVKGSPNSLHKLGCACDFRPYDPGVTLVQIALDIAQNFEFRELILEYYPTGWVHVAYQKGNNTKAIKLKDKTHNYTPLSLAQLSAM